MRDPRRRQQGQIIVMFALAMALFLFSLFVAVVDLDFMFTWSARVQAAAQIAAQTGANSIRPAFLYTGQPPIIETNAASPAYFKTACQTNGNLSANITSGDIATYPGSGTRCITQLPQGCAVAATIVKHVVFPLTPLGLGADVRGTFVAAPVIGANSPSAAQNLCPYFPPPP